MHTFIMATQLLAATSTKAKHSGGSNIFLFLIPILILGYFFFIRPQKQRQRRAQQARSGFEEGDTVVTIGGIVGKVVALDDQPAPPPRPTGFRSAAAAQPKDEARAVLEIAPGLEMEILRRAIAHKVDPATVTEDAYEDEEDEEDYDEAEAHDLAEDPAEDPERGWHGYHPEQVHQDGEPEDVGPSPVPEPDAAHRPAPDLGAVFGTAAAGPVAAGTALPNG
ncbi:MAG: preprotein translocase subunit YajC, partial [Acidimicrobiales bacterium]